MDRARGNTGHLRVCSALLWLAVVSVPICPAQEADALAAARAEIAQLREEAAVLNRKYAEAIKELLNAVEKIATLQLELAQAKRLLAGGAAPPDAPRPAGLVKSALELNTGTKLKLGPILAYTKEQQHDVSDHGTYLAWRKLNILRDGAYVFADGRILIVSGQPLGSLKDRDRLVDAAILITSALAKVNTEVKQHDGWLMYKPRYHAEQPGVFKVLSFFRKGWGNVKVRIDVPDCKVHEARLACTAPFLGWGRGLVYDDSVVPKGGDIAKWMRFGSQTLVPEGDWRDGEVHLEAMTSPTDEHLTAKFDNEVVTDSVPCLPVRNLVLPAQPVLSP